MARKKNNNSGLFKKLFSKIFPKRKDVKKIYKTTDGYLNNKSYQKKPRHVVVIDQRNDGAVALIKIYSEKNKKNKNTNAYIKNVVLEPSKHKVLKERSIVGNQVYIGVKQSNGNYNAIKTRELEATNDRLTKEEYRKIKKNVQNDTKKHRRTYKRKMKRWHKHFK